MKLVVVYVYPIFGGEHDTFANRFATHYALHTPPESPTHDLIVVSNGGPPKETMRKVFTSRALTPRWVEHDDTGWEIGAYRKVAREVPADLMVFFGGSGYPMGKRWLHRVTESFSKHGPAIYGATASHLHNVHIRTTGFWMPPDLLNKYPHVTTSQRSSRYQFEHGSTGLTCWVISQGLRAWMVTWSGEYGPGAWKVPNGYHRGDQSDLIIGDRVTGLYRPRPSQAPAPRLSPPLSPPAARLKPRPVQMSAPLRSPPPPTMRLRPRGRRVI